MIEATASKLLTDRASYQSWPVVTRAADGAIVVAYASGAAQHEAEDDTRGVYVVRSIDQGVTWGPPILVVNSATGDESTYGIGVNADGDLLLWVRIVEGSISNELYRSTDSGQTWALYGGGAFTAQPVLVGPIVTAEGVLYAPYHAGPESGEATRSWGHLQSTDDGATWTQIQLGTAADDASWPIEPRYHVSDDGQRMIAVARNRVVGQPLWQYCSANGGTSWTAPALTNIADQANTPSTLVGPDDDLLILYFDRSAGRMRARSTTFDAIYGSPTSWPPSTVVAYGTNYNQDNGYPHAIRHGAGALCVWYSGMYRYPGIYAFTVRTGGTIAPRPTRIIDRITASPAGILTVASNDISWSVPASSAPTKLLVAKGLVVIADEEWTHGQLYWRLLAGGAVGELADVLTVSAHYYRDTNARVDPAQPQLTFDSTTNVDKDTGWIALPTDFGHTSATGRPSRYRVDIRARLNTGAVAAGKVNADTTLLFGVA